MTKEGTNNKLTGKRKLLTLDFARRVILTLILYAGMAANGISVVLISVTLSDLAEFTGVTTTTYGIIFVIKAAAMLVAGLNAGWVIDLVVKKFQDKNKFYYPSLKYVFIICIFCIMSQNFILPTVKNIYINLGVTVISGFGTQTMYVIVNVYLDFVWKGYNQKLVCSLRSTLFFSFLTIAFVFPFITSTIFERGYSAQVNLLICYGITCVIDVVPFSVLLFKSPEKISPKEDEITQSEEELKDVQLEANEHEDKHNDQVTEDREQDETERKENVIPPVMSIIELEGEVEDIVQGIITSEPTVSEKQKNTTEEQSKTEDKQEEEVEKKDTKKKGDLKKKIFMKSSRAVVVFFALISMTMSNCCQNIPWNLLPTYAEQAGISKSIGSLLVSTFVGGNLAGLALNSLVFSFLGINQAIVVIVGTTIILIAHIVLCFFRTNLVVLFIAMAFSGLGIGPQISAIIETSKLFRMEPTAFENSVMILGIAIANFIAYPVNWAMSAWGYDSFVFINTAVTAILLAGYCIYVILGYLYVHTFHKTISLKEKDLGTIKINDIEIFTTNWMGKKKIITNLEDVKNFVSVGKNEDYMDYVLEIPDSSLKISIPENKKTKFEKHIFQNLRIDEVLVN